MKQNTLARNGTSGRRNGRRLWILIPVGALAVVAVSIGLIVGDLLKQPGHTDVHIVDEVVVPSQSLDHVVIPTEIPMVTIEPQATPALGPAITISPHSGAVEWVNGVSRVYVVDGIPIQRMERKDPLVENILLFGVDSRSSEYIASRTDMIMILTIDQRNNAIKLSSIMRDTEVSVPGLTKGVKINSVYAYGGIGLFVNTLNQYFDLDIQEFVMVDMLGAEQVVDLAGGVSINVSASEIPYVNGGVSAANELFKDFSSPSAYLSISGLQRLNGRQTVAYARIRKIGTDTARTARQRKVLSALIEKFRNVDFSKKYDLLKRSLGSMSTNMDSARLASLAVENLQNLDTTEQFRIPMNDTFTVDQTTQDLIIDREETSKALHDFIWGAG